ncbi:RagB/SusD family nutrient uptake outer membrane protein [Wenyingzhuangia sp. 1_MG-2023]|nr:RagB/SusD family nutrient uptake outer membrane protein [Wenyingzhuangia sp. 1_MG-2023]
MKYLKFKNIIGVFMLFGLLSCSDESLTEINPNQPVASWNNLSDTQKGLNSVYNSLLDENLLGIIEESWRSDLGYPGYGRPTPTNGESLPFYYQTYTNNAEFIAAKWDACYATIYYANQVIDGLNSIEASIEEDQKEAFNTQMGQARFFRGLMHFYLFSTYNNGSIIIRNEIPTVATGFGKELSPASDVRDFFREDLLYAYENLPEKYDNDYLGSATKWAAATALGKSYLYEATDGPDATGDYSQAMVYFNQIINNNSFQLADPDLMFTKDGEFNKESIFELAYNTEHRQSLSVFEDGKLSNTLSFASTGTTGFFMPVWMIYAYKSEELDLADSRNVYVEPGGGTIIRPVSLRASSMAAIVNDELTDFGTKKTTEAITIQNKGFGFGYYKKYVDHDDSDPRGVRSAGVNVVVNRLAEVYLMQAECLIQTGDLEGALKLINKIRYRWALQLLGQQDSDWPDATFESDKDRDGTIDADYVDYTQETLMDRLMYVEKPLELSVEGHAIRWIDLRRWGIIKENFNRLANSTYYAQNYDYPKRDSNTGEKTGVIATIKNGDIVDVDPGATGLNIIDYEYDAAANNYSPALNDYFPIPLNEVLRNPLLN